MEELLPIGEFSARCGLSAKMLRTYAAAGLLAPAAVDRDSGYRYYAPAQERHARLTSPSRLSRPFRYDDSLSRSSPGPPPPLAATDSSSRSITCGPIIASTVSP